MFIYLNKRGQGTLEYAILIAIIVGALIAMSVYIKRGVQGRLRQASDDIGEQFSPGYTTSNITTNTSATVHENRFEDGTSSTNTESQWQNRSGWENVMKSSNEYWGQDN